MDGPMTFRERAGRAACAVALAAFAVVLVRTAWISDDAFITLRTVDNFVHGYGLRWNVAERVQTFTHPLWLLLIVPFYAITREPFYTVLGLSAIVSLVAVALLALPAVRRRDPWAALIMLGVLLFSKSFVDYSTSGLENPLTHLLLAVLVLLLVDEAVPTRPRVLLVALTAGLGVLARADNLLLFGPALALVLWRHRRWRGLGAAAAGLAPAVLWHAFATLYYGIPYPNTALAKLNTGIPAGELAAQGWRYLGNSLTVDPLTLLAIVAGVATGLAARRPVPAALAAGVVLYVAYVVRIGGDFMSGRFLSAPLFLAVGLLGGAVRGATPWRPLAATIATLGLGFAAPYPTVLSGSRYGTRLAEAVDEHGIADERRYYFSESGVFNGIAGWRRPVSDSWRTGRQLRAGDVPLTVESAVGFFGHAAGPGVHVVDSHGLGDPLLSRMPAVRRDPFYDTFREQFQLPPSPTGWRTGHYLRRIPRGYLRTLADGENRLADPGVAALYDDVALLTRAPVWSGARLRTVLRLLAGGLPEAPRPEYTPVPWSELVETQPDNPEGWLGRGLARQRRGDRDGALADLRQAVRLHPGHGRALVAMASLLGTVGRGDEGLELLDRVLSLDPRDAMAWRFRASLLAQRGRHREALRAFETTARLDPRLSADMLVNAALQHVRLGEPDEALAALDRAEALDPRLARTHLLRGKLWASRERAHEAVASFERALELDPGLEQAALDLAAVHVATGDRRAARDVLDRFARSHPDSAEVLFRQGLLLAEEGQAALAAERWRASAALGHAGARAALDAATPDR